MPRCQDAKMRDANMSNCLDAKIVQCRAQGDMPRCVCLLPLLVVLRSLRVLLRRRDPLHLIGVAVGGWLLLRRVCWLRRRSLQHCLRRHDADTWQMITTLTIPPITHPPHPRHHQRHHCQHSTAITTTNIIATSLTPSPPCTNLLLGAMLRWS